MKQRDVSCRSPDCSSDPARRARSYRPAAGRRWSAPSAAWRRRGVVGVAASAVQHLVGEPVASSLALQPSPPGTGGWARQLGESAGHFSRTWIWSWWQYQGRTFAIQPSCALSLDPAQLLLDHGVDQHALDLGLLGGGLDEGDVLRCPGLRIEVLPVVGDQIGGEMVFSRSSLLSTWPGIGMNQMSTSRPIWWLAWPNGSGPPRGCARSPTRMPFQPVALAASGANFSRKLIKLGWPQLRLRDSRITCQVGPVAGSGTPPAGSRAGNSRSPWPCRGGQLLAPNSCFAGRCSPFSCSAAAAFPAAAVTAMRQPCLRNARAPGDGEESGDDHERQDEQGHRIRLNITFPIYQVRPRLSG